MRGDTTLSEEPASTSTPVRRDCGALLGERIVRRVDAGHAKCVLVALKALANVKAERLTAKVMEATVLSHKRPDVAVALLLQVLEEGRPATAAFVAAATWRCARPEALLCVFHRLMCTGRVTDAANLVLELIRHGEAPVVADLLISLLEEGSVEDARDIVAVLLAKGHAAEVAQQSLWMVRVERAQAVAQLRAALVQSGGLALACDAQKALEVLNETAAAIAFHQLVRMGHVDVAARMIIHLVDEGHVGPVCKWIEGLDRQECHETLLQLSITIAKMSRSDVNAAIMGALVESGRLDLAKHCMLDVIKRSHPWVTSAMMIEMVRLGKAKEAARTAVQLSMDGENVAPIEAHVLMLPRGYAPEWAAIMHEVIKLGHADVTARRTALLIKTGRPHLAMMGARALAQTATPRALAEVMLKMVELGEAEAAAELLAELAKYAPTVACDLTGHSNTAASLMLRLLDTEKVATVMIINNYIIQSGHVRAAATLASAMAARTDVQELMDTFDAAAARMLPEV
ncbi:hypothetical protein COCOBI_19-1450 [Coccomyxa sp. Obi]|nr:hypothetical protein COCOBI_19-1450 [Coccomyxa sp. Obi]